MPGLRDFEAVSTNSGDREVAGLRLRLLRLGLLGLRLLGFGLPGLHRLDLRGLGLFPLLLAQLLDIGEQQVLEVHGVPPLLLEASCGVSPGMLAGGAVGLAPAVRP